MRDTEANEIDGVKLVCLVLFFCLLQQYYLSKSVVVLCKVEVVHIHDHARAFLFSTG
jgi:hypothetical protein